MENRNFITIKDTNTSPLWDGEEVYMLAVTPLTITGQNNTSAVQKNFLDIDVSNDEDVWANNWDRRKSSISYGGFTNPTITLSVVYNPITIGNTIIVKVNGGAPDEKPVFSPSKLFELVLKPRVVYLNDEVLIRSLLANSEGTSPAIYSSNGIPVVLQGYDFTSSIEGQEITMNLTFIEAKDV